MPRLPHGRLDITPETIRSVRDAIEDRIADIPLAFARVKPVDTRRFDFLFPELQDDDDNLLAESPETRDELVALGEAMADDGSDASTGDLKISAAYTYFGQFVDHDVTLEASSATGSQLTSPDLAPLPLDRIREETQNVRTALLELDSVYGLPAPRDGRKMRMGTVTDLGDLPPPRSRPADKANENDLPREPPSVDVVHDRAALIGDPRNDENTIIAQLHVAFLLAHNKLVDEGNNFKKAKRILRQHYQHIILHDFLKEQIADKRIVEDTIDRNRVYDPDDDEFFLPLEYSVAAFRFGHSMVRAAYDFNLNFNRSGDSGTTPATLALLFTFTALSGQLGFPGVPGGENRTLPENWIIEWENFFGADGGEILSKARRIDTELVEPLEHLRILSGQEEGGLAAKLAVRNLLRGYLLRIPTGQAVARALKDKLKRKREIPVLTPEQIEKAAENKGTLSQDNRTQVQVLRDAGFLERTPLWYYILAEAAALGEGKNLGPVGSTIVAEVLVGLVRRSPDSILRERNWEPTLPSQEPGTFTLPDLLRFAGVLESP